MALVMLPCDLPWWTSVQRHLKHLLLASSCDKILKGMLKINDMCNISLDPDEDCKDEELFKEFETFLEEDFTEEERKHFIENTLRSMINRALHLKKWKPEKGLMFSLQQHSEVVELEYNFVSSLVANAFFSTFPNRTLKTHPTLQDFNFKHFFKHLQSKIQRFKLKSLFQYFDWLENNNNSEGVIKFTRKVMTSKQWLTIEDWQECTLPLCKLVIRHEGRPERCENDEALRVCFASRRIGGDALVDGESQEALSMFMIPELLSTMLFQEALEDNEVLIVEGVRMFTRLIEPKQKGNFEALDLPKILTVCVLDAENYSVLPVRQWEEDNVLRELNKSLLGFQQSPRKQRSSERRLSPIGESGSASPEVEATVIIKQTSCSTLNSFCSRSPSPDPYIAATINLQDKSIEITRNRSLLSPEPSTLNNRRGRFIVLGSSGEHLPVNRPFEIETKEEDSMFSSCDSSGDDYHSAHDSFELDAQTGCKHDRVRALLSRETTGDWSTDSSSYAVGISISGPQLHDPDIKVRRGGSVGFVLTEQESVSEEQMPEDYHKSCSRKSHGQLCDCCARRDTGNSSKYSFTTDYTSELEEVYEQFNQFMDDQVVDAESGELKQRELDSRDVAVIRFADSLLKRTLSESFAGMPLTEGCENSVGMEIDMGRHRAIGNSKQKLALTARSLSLELAKHKHRLASQLLSQLAQKIVTGGISKPIVTGNWGCGRRLKGDPQLKLMLQWLAASVAGVPALIYYTAGNKNLYKLDTLVRVVVDRKWTVGELMTTVLRNAQHTIGNIDNDSYNQDLFDEIIGIEKCSYD